jgi:hypothetical protein
MNVNVIPSYGKACHGDTEAQRRRGVSDQNLHEGLRSRNYGDERVAGGTFGPP